MEAAQVHILPESKQPREERDGKGKDIKAILLNPQAFVLAHLEPKFYGVSILDNSAILSVSAKQWLCSLINVSVCVCVSVSERRSSVCSGLWHYR